MKCRLYILFILASIPQTAKSQSSFAFGPRIGTSYSTFLTSRGSVSGGLGLVAGGMGTYSLGESFQVLANLDYHQIRGGTQYSSINAGAFSFTSNSLTIHAGEASGAVGYKIPGDMLGTAALWLVGGGSIAYNFYTENTRSTFVNGSLSSSTNSEAATSSFATWLYAVQAGIQIEFALGEDRPSEAVLDLRYRRNINPILNGLSAQGTGSAADIYAESFCMTLGFKIN